MSTARSRTCPWCNGDGEVVAVHLVGDGIPGERARLEQATEECLGCAGTGEFDPDEAYHDE